MENDLIDKVAVLGGRRPVDTIIIHTSDSPDDRTSVNAKEIDRWHKERGFKMIGYHYVVCKNGKLEQGRHLETVGAHCKGHNQFSIGICWVGRHDLNAAQRETLIAVVAKLLEIYKLKVDAVKGHHDFEPYKTCPNIDMQQLRDDISDYQRRINVGHSQAGTSS